MVKKKKKNNVILKNRTVFEPNFLFSLNWVSLLHIIHFTGFL